MFCFRQFFLSFILITLFPIALFAQDATNLKLFEQLIPNLEKSVAAEDPVDKKQLIDEININGTQHIDSADIKQELTIRKGDKFNKTQLTRNLKRIKKIGIFKQVDHKVKDTSNGKVIDIFVEEYPLITDVVFAGNNFFTDDYLKEHILSLANQPYNITAIKKDISNIEKLYQDAGLFNAKIYNVIGPKESAAPVTFYIAEGVIEDIIITGNIKTQDYVILREMDIRPGDPIRQVSLQKNIRKVFNLQYFEDVYPEIYPGEKPHQYILKLNIKERETSGSFAVGGGYSPNVGFNLFSDLYVDNLMGTGRMVMLKGNFGISNSEGENKNSTYQFRYTDPWAFGKRRSLSLRAWLTQGSMSSYSPLTSSFSYRNEYRTGFDALTSIPHSYDFRSSHRIKYESVELVDSDYLYQIYSYELGLVYDKRNLAINTTAGSFYQFSIEQSFALDSTAINFTQYDITYKKYIPTFDKQTIAAQFKLGLLRTVGFDNDDIMTAQQYYVGGSRSVRGYPDNDPFARGNKQVLATIEYRYIFNTSLFFYFFVDAGYATYFQTDDDEWVSQDYRDFSGYKIGKGIGVNITVPGLGPLKLDYGINEDNNGMVQFNIGYSF